MIHFVLLISRQGKVRLTKWYSPYNAKDKARAVREVSATVLARQQKQCNFLEYKDKKIIYKRYASLYFLACVDEEDNELIVLETIHHFVEVRAAAYHHRHCCCCFHRGRCCHRCCCCDQLHSDCDHGHPHQTLSLSLSGPQALPPPL